VPQLLLAGRSREIAYADVVVVVRVTPCGRSLFHRQGPPGVRMLRHAPERQPRGGRRSLSSSRGVAPGAWNQRQAGVRHLGPGTMAAAVRGARVLSAKALVSMSVAVGPWPLALSPKGSVPADAAGRSLSTASGVRPGRVGGDRNATVAIMRSPSTTSLLALRFDYDRRRQAGGSGTTSPLCTKRVIHLTQVPCPPGRCDRRGARAVANPCFRWWRCGAAWWPRGVWAGVRSRPSGRRWPFGYRQPDSNG
jgi:hypothetical protein